LPYRYGSALLLAGTPAARTPARASLYADFMTELPAQRCMTNPIACASMVGRSCRLIDARIRQLADAAFPWRRSSHRCLSCRPPHRSRSRRSHRRVDLRYHGIAEPHSAGGPQRLLGGCKQSELCQSTRSVFVCSEGRQTASSYPIGGRGLGPRHRIGHAPASARFAGVRIVLCLVLSGGAHHAIFHSDGCHCLHWAFAACSPPGARREAAGAVDRHRCLRQPAAAGAT
jgi:hypothetical protein